MKQSIKTRLDKLSAKIGINGGPRCLCTMSDGSKKVMYGYSLIGYRVHNDSNVPLEIVDIKTDDPNYYNFFSHLLSDNGRVTVSLVKRVL